MSALESSSTKRKGGTEQDFELNLASIIDCFTVLITYLLCSAQLISLGVYDVTTVANSDSVESSAKPNIQVALELDQDKHMRVRVTGSESQTSTFPPKNGNWDLGAMSERLEALKTKWPETNAIILAAENGVEYKEIVQAIEAAKKTFNTVALGDRQGG